MDTSERGPRRLRRRPGLGRGLRSLSLPFFIFKCALCPAFRSEDRAADKLAQHRDGARPPQPQPCSLLRPIWKADLPLCSSGWNRGSEKRSALSAARRDQRREDCAGERLGPGARSWPSPLLGIGRRVRDGTPGALSLGPAARAQPAGQRPLCGWRWPASPSPLGARSRPQHRVMGGRAEALSAQRTRTPSRPAGPGTDT